MEDCSFSIEKEQSRLHRERFGIVSRTFSIQKERRWIPK
jgi:hypothetical protein